MQLATWARWIGTQALTTAQCRRKRRSRSLSRRRWRRQPPRHTPHGEQAPTPMPQSTSWTASRQARQRQHRQQQPLLPVPA